MKEDPKVAGARNLEKRLETEMGGEDGEGR